MRSAERTGGVEQTVHTARDLTAMAVDQERPDPHDRTVLGITVQRPGQFDEEAHATSGPSDVHSFLHVRRGGYAVTRTGERRHRGWRFRGDSSECDIALLVVLVTTL